jgi:multidrug efflux system membrane fusion protein
MSPPRRFRWGFIPLGLVLIGLIVWLAIAGRKPAQARTPPPVPVSTAQATTQDVPLTVTALGAAQAWQGVLINPLISGRLDYVAKEGDMVRAGQVLARIDCGPFTAALTQAKGSLARDQGSLEGARRNLVRYQDLVNENSIARQTMEDQAATVKQDEGAVLADKGAVAAAQVNVERCAIHSPINGRVGVRIVDAGNIVVANMTTGIISVNQIQPIAVTFTVPQGDFQRLAAASAGFTRPLQVEAFSQETGAALGAGVLSVADNHVDQATGTVQMKARFENSGSQLWPGQFVNVTLTMQVLQHAVTIPASAVNQGPNGAYAYVVGSDRRAVPRPVSVLTTQGGVAVVQSGVTAGETVVTDGQMSLKPGAPVAVEGAGQKGRGGPAGRAGSRPAGRRGPA